MNPTVLDIKRINALTDATFGVAMTILILTVEVPEGLNINTMHKILSDEIYPALMNYFLSFIILGAFWNESHYHNHLIVKSDVISSWMYIFFLMFICVVPFSSHFVLHYPKDKTSIIFYLINLLIINGINIFIAYYTWKRNFLRPHASAAHCKKVIFRNSVPSLFYLMYIPMSFYFTDWILFLFPLPLVVQILIGNFEKRVIHEENESEK